MGQLKRCHLIELNIYFFTFLVLTVLDIATTFIGIKQFNLTEGNLIASNMIMFSPKLYIIISFWLVYLLHIILYKKIYLKHYSMTIPRIAYIPLIVLKLIVVIINILLIKGAY